MKIIKFSAFGLLIIILPILLAFTMEKDEPSIKEPIKKEKRTSDRGIYVTASTAQSSSRLNYLIKQCKNLNLNTMVIDVKEVVKTDALELAKEKMLNSDFVVEPSEWLKKLTARLHEEGFIVTARVVAFKDDHLVIARPDLGIHLAGGALYRDRKGGRWANPYLREVRLYNEIISEIAAASGVDEIQFDYIRFPTEGAAKSIPYNTKTTKVEIINEFLKGTKARLDKYNVSLAVDIFGITAWQDLKDVNSLGQSLEAMSKYLDVLSPMLYPSHFHAGYDGFSNPGSYPYHFMNTGVKKSQEILASAECTTKLVPWIQGFNMRSPNFGSNYIREQIKACHDEGIDSFLIWNARNVYDSVPKYIGF
ncbi:MAG: GTP-binding protein [Candidatus Saganbacteria bacterium]|uniref:GTP-binding protein n=1 Tax=Candidatus Saganbacteria bacterium TaxID=2575572 RepID=A0A833P047_UNCSA|nr:MAG: GTP-binding protein [Candidatus Saganbacteria bacterium]